MKAVCFRPTPEIQERLEFAQKVGISVSETMNAVLQKHLKTYLLHRAKAELKKLDRIKKEINVFPFKSAKVSKKMRRAA